MLNRKQSYNQLTQSSLAAIPDATAGYGLSTPMRRAGFTTGGPATADIEIGDTVNTPGGLWGIVKFIGPVRGKNGVFVGVELDREVASKGKNDGSVDGVQYFQTSAPQAGIFVPLSKASKRDSTSSIPPLTPTSLQPPQPISTSPRRAESPAIGRPGTMKALRTPGRPSLGRPESPTRRNITTPGGLGRGLAPPGTPGTRSISGAPPAGRLLLSPTPGTGRLLPPNKTRQGSVSSSTASASENSLRPGTASGIRPPPTPKSNPAAKGRMFGMRSKSSMEHRGSDDGSLDSPSDIGLAQGSPTRRNFADHGEVMALRAKLAERDNQLKQQQESLAEMESSLNELQALMSSAEMQSPTRNPHEEADVITLRALLREKNDKIHELTTEFDAHRADFRQTIDALELASSETERVYERKIEELNHEIQELQERDEEMENVAMQLKQLSEVVTDLEEGLEDARRGEAEARAEVEFLRGEVERVREELRREKEKNSLISKGNVADELTKKNDEIRGLKAIIQSLSGGASPDSVMGGSAGDRNSGGALANGKRNGLSSKSIMESEEFMAEKERRERLEREIRELQATIEEKASKEDELRDEIERMKSRKRGHSVTSNATTGTERTVIGSRSSRNLDVGDEKRNSGRDSRGTLNSWRTRANHVSTSSVSSSGKVISESVPEETTNTATISDGDSDGEGLWCEICETGGHDILTCTKMFGTTTSTSTTENKSSPTTTTPAAVSAPSGSASSPVTTKPTPPVTTERKKSVHLPAAPPLVDTGSGPVAGKSSGVVDNDKWCALCERDGHDTADCPFEDPF